jgi:hypothetical protein
VLKGQMFLAQKGGPVALASRATGFQGHTSLPFYDLWVADALGALA